MADNGWLVDDNGINMDIPSGNDSQFAIENGTFSALIYLLNMVIFPSVFCKRLPEGKLYIPTSCPNTIWLFNIAMENHHFQ